MEFLNALDPTTKLVVIGVMVVALAILFFTRPSRS